MSIFTPGKKSVNYSRPSQSQRPNKPKERLNRCHTAEGILPCKKCCLPTANGGRVCTACLDVLTPFRLNVQLSDQE